MLTGQLTPLRFCAANSSVSRLTKRGAETRAGHTDTSHYESIFWFYFDSVLTLRALARARPTVLPTWHRDAAISENGYWRQGETLLRRPVELFPTSTGAHYRHQLFIMWYCVRALWSFSKVLNRLCIYLFFVNPVVLFYLGGFFHKGLGCLPSLWVRTGSSLPLWGGAALRTQNAELRHHIKRSTSTTSQVEWTGKKVGPSWETGLGMLNK